MILQPRPEKRRASHCSAHSCTKRANTLLHRRQEKSHPEGDGGSGRWGRLGFLLTGCGGENENLKEYHFFEKNKRKKRNFKIFPLHSWSVPCASRQRQGQIKWKRQILCTRTAESFQVHISFYWRIQPKAVLTHELQTGETFPHSQQGALHGHFSRQQVPLASPLGEKKGCSDHI